MRKAVHRLWVFALLLSSVSALGEHTRVTNPNALSVEALGRAMLWSINFDRVVTDDIVVGFGYGMSPTQTVAGGDSTKQAQFIPVYFNFYFAREQGSLFATGGVSIIANNTSLAGLETSFGGLEFKTSLGVAPTLGVGYENRGDFGFLFRGAAYAVYAGNFAPWVGFSFGYAF